MTDEAIMTKKSSEKTILKQIIEYVLHGLASFRIIW